jgi:hypothetical protein
MSTNLKAFLKKNQSKAPAKPTDQNKEVEAQEEAKKAMEAKVQANENQQADGASSDEEVEDDINLDVQYGNIKDTKDINDKTEEDTKIGFGYEDSLVTK